MTDPDDREASVQSQILLDADAAFRVSARRNRLLAHWAAEQMELTPEETAAYSKAVIQSDFEGAGDEDVIRKVLGDLVAAGCDVDQAGVRAALEEKAVEARRQLMGESDMAMPAAEIEALIKAALPDAEVEIEALVDDGDHYRARVVSTAFVGKNRVQQHKLVYEALGGRMGGELHALQLVTAVPN